jgi:hypothetical protein
MTFRTQARKSPRGRKASARGQAEALQDTECVPSPIKGMWPEVEREAVLMPGDGAPSELRGAFHEADAFAGAGQQDGGGQPAEASAYHHDVE